MSRASVRPAVLVAVFLLSTFAALAALVSCGSDAVVSPVDAAGPDASPVGDASSTVDVDGEATKDASDDVPFVDPDPNEPNDTVPTPITFDEDGGVRAGSKPGVLATAGDVDRFAFDVDPGTHVVYARVTAPALVPETNVRLRYELRGPGVGGPLVASGEAKDGRAVDLGTARLATAGQGGTYSLIVTGVSPPGGVAPGDPRLAYVVDVRILPVSDALEPNDTIAQSIPRALTNPAPSSTTTFTGRIGWVADEDWFRVDLPASAAPTVLSYRLAPTGPGRFARLPGPRGLRVRAMSAVSAGATACKTTQVACPKGYDAASAEWVAQVEALCDASDAPMCLQSARIEHAPHAALSNFAGAIPIPAHAATISVWFVVDDTDADGADDVPFALDVTWANDADEAARTTGGVEQESTFSLAADPGTSYPLPAPDVPVISGRLTYGFGLRAAIDPASPDAARGPDDYDAIPSDVDTYRMLFPSLPKPEDRTWALSWTVETEGSSTPAHDLVVDVTFCDGDALNAGSCTEVSTRGDGTPLRFTSPGPLVPWPVRPNGAAIDHFTTAITASGALDAGTLVTSATSTARAEACFCFEPRFVRGGYARLRVRAADRRSYAPSRYEIRTSYVPYPKSASCPAPATQADGGSEPGCRFAR